LADSAFHFVEHPIPLALELMRDLATSRVLETRLHIREGFLPRLGE
jgi:hypothetical protein